MFLSHSSNALNTNKLSNNAQEYFCNTFKAESSRDAVFYLLYVWKQLGLDGGRDELHLSGAIPSPWIEDTLHRYVHRVCPINLSACFNRAPITRMKQMPFDIITYYMKGK